MLSAGVKDTSLKVTIDQKTFQGSFFSHAGGLVRVRGRARLASHGVQSDQRLLPVAHL